MDEARNVQLSDIDGNVVSGFWQYGLVNWTTFYDLLHTVVVCAESWTIYVADESNESRRGAHCPASNVAVEPGFYVILGVDGTAIRVGHTVATCRLRHPTMSNTPARRDHYRVRARERDGKCLVTGRRVVGGDYSRFKAAHIFPRAHDQDWIRKGYPSKITDPAPLSAVGGMLKIDSLQNVILLDSGLHEAWDNYKFAVNPDANYVVFPFVGGYEDIAGKHLLLDHIQDQNIRPLAELFRDHFLQCVLKNMKGAGEKDWDYEDAVGGGTLDLSRTDLWGGQSGRGHLEFELASRLYSHTHQAQHASQET